MAGVRRELTGIRKELSILSNQQRSFISKIDNIAVMTERLAETVLLQRRALSSLAAQIATVLATGALSTTPGASPPAAYGSVGSPASGLSPQGHTVTPQAIPAAQVQDSQWVLKVKVRDSWS